MLRIAVPNKGSLSDTASEMLARGRLHRTPRPEGPARHRPGQRGRVLLPAPQGHRDLRRLRRARRRHHRPRPAARCADAGRDARSSRSASASSTFRFAGPPGRFTTVEDLEGVRVATAYPGLVDGYLDEHGVAVDLVPLDGAVESAVRLGVADAVADVVSTGTTLKQAGLEIFGPVLLESEAVLIGPDRGRRHRDAAAATARRHGRAALRADRLRPAGRPGR